MVTTTRKRSGPPPRYDHRKEYESTLSEMRVNLGLTIKELCANAGIPINEYSGLNSGTLAPIYQRGGVRESALKLASYLDYSLEDIWPLYFCPIARKEYTQEQILERFNPTLTGNSVNVERTVEQKELVQSIYKYALSKLSEEELRLFLEIVVFELNFEEYRQKYNGTKTSTAYRNRLDKIIERLRIIIRMQIAKGTIVCDDDKPHLFKEYKLYKRENKKKEEARRAQEGRINKIRERAERRLAIERKKREAAREIFLKENKKKAIKFLRSTLDMSFDIHSNTGKFPMYRVPEVVLKDILLGIGIVSEIAEELSSTLVKKRIEFYTSIYEKYKVNVKHFRTPLALMSSDEIRPSTCITIRKSRHSPDIENIFKRHLKIEGGGILKYALRIR